MAKNYKLTLRYDGTSYSGWQIQPNVRTIQGELSRALEIITKNSVELIGVSRTDAGVHALSYVCNCRMDTDISPDVLFRSINGILDNDIRLTDISICPDDFNARADSLAKTYVYTIDNTYWGDPFLRGRSWHWGAHLDIDKMKRAASFFIGTHDFSSFMSKGSSAIDFVRTVYCLLVYENDGVIRIEITGNGFLYNMVRIIAGTLLLVGCNKIQADSIGEIILKKDRSAAGITAPPQGLALKKIFYSEEELKCFMTDHHCGKEF